MSLVSGELQSSGTLRIFRKGFHKTHISSQGKESILHFQTLQKDQETTLVEIELPNRPIPSNSAQFFCHSHPIVGDLKYGGINSEQLCLLHFYLEFIHPVTKASLFFSYQDGIKPIIALFDQHPKPVSFNSNL